jgi:nitrate reductase assembly molybdenum cofactor insertion protein NarJ
MESSQNIAYSHYNILADIFRYPDVKYKESVDACSQILKDNYPDAYENMAPFFEYIGRKSLYEIEENFSKTFHIQAVCYLDIGYVLFAEDYKRGEFLVRMKNEQENVNNDCGIELADNLPNVLTLMPMLKDQEFREEFVVRILIPALEKMLAEFDSARMELKDKVRMKKQKVIILNDLEHKNLYEHVIRALLMVVKTDFNKLIFNDPPIKPTLGGEVLKNCGSCSTTNQPVK